MAGSGGLGGSAGDIPNGGHPQGTEYTLQGELNLLTALAINSQTLILPFILIGVMRFLQTEWHRHERERNAWEIERAEMKSRIGRLEGDARTSKRLHESLGKHIKLLETALKREREKVKSLMNGEKVEDLRDPKEVAKENLKSIRKCLTFSLDLVEQLLTRSSSTELHNAHRRRTRRPKSARLPTR